MTAADQWRWTDDEGVQRLLSGDELRAALQDGRLQPSVLVWKRGMAKWLPAADVNELARVVRRPGSMPNVPAPAPMPQRASVPPPARGQQRSYPAAPAARPSGGWSDGAARNDEDEPTVTNIRKEELEQAAGRSGNDNPWARTLPKARKAVRPPTGARSTTTDTEVLGPDGRPKQASRPPPPKRSTRPPPPKLRSRQPTKKGHKLASPQRRSGGSVPPPRRTGSVPPPKRAAGAAAGRQRKPSGVIPSVRVPTQPLPGQMQGTIREAAPSPAQLVGREPRTPLGNQPSAPSMAKTAVSPGASPPRNPSAPGPVRARQPAAPAQRAAQPSAARAEQPPPRAEPSNAGRPSIDSLSAAIPKAPRVPQLNGLGTAAASKPSTPGLGLFDDDEQVPARQSSAQLPTHIPPSLAERRGILLPVPLVAAVGGGLLLLLIISFVVGRASAPAEAGMAEAIRARTGWVAVPLFTRQQSDYGTPRPCLMARAPARIDATASQRVPMELLPLSGNRVAIGFAASPVQGRGVIYNMMSASSEVAFEPDEADGVLSRVVPIANEDGARFEVSLKQQDDLRDSVVVPAETPWTLAFRGNDVVRVNGNDATELWNVTPAGKAADSIRTVRTKQGFAVTFRNGREVYAGQLDGAGKDQVKATKVGETDGIMGRPSVGYNGSQIAVTFAELPKGKKGAELRLSRGESGKPLTEASPVELPPGGPGIGAIAPAIAGLSGGRWLLLWTEGGRGNRALRAQTYDHSMRTVGEALRVSPATGSFGQGTVTVVGERAIVGFLLRTRRGFELWSTVLQCQ